MPEMLTPKEVAETLKISYEAALKFIKYSGIDYHRIGNQYRISSEKLRVFLNKKGPIYTDFSGGC